LAKRMISSCRAWQKFLPQKPSTAGTSRGSTLKTGVVDDPMVKAQPQFIEKHALVRRSAYAWRLQGLARRPAPTNLPRPRSSGLPFDPLTEAWVWRLCAFDARLSRTMSSADYKRLGERQERGVTYTKAFGSGDPAPPPRLKVQVRRPTAAQGEWETPSSRRGAT